MLYIQDVKRNENWQLQQLLHKRKFIQTVVKLLVILVFTYLRNPVGILGIPIQMKSVLIDYLY
ncbi:unnamed protein product [Schistosoma curassoni]|uniref:DoxX family protein n=1 Tax=Schistosoma curassoni TaxID=6186 RepID=A0A183L7Y1_9TREM|nr:unnamed protein product [Schistosoma curassoni]